MTLPQRPATSSQPRRGKKHHKLPAMRHGHQLSPIRIRRRISLTLRLRGRPRAILTAVANIGLGEGETRAPCPRRAPYDSGGNSTTTHPKDEYSARATQLIPTPRVQIPQALVRPDMLEGFSLAHLFAGSLLRRRWRTIFGGRFLRQIIALALAALLLPMSCGELLAQQASPPQFGHPQQDYSGQIQSDEYGYPAQPYAPAQNYPQQSAAPAAVQPLGADRLDQLVAPIALYPDGLVALVLTASTYPAQIQDADGWRQAQGDAPAEQIAATADAQNWDPSVKALTAFPQVLEQMDQNLAWTTDLGTAYYNQPNDVLQGVQVMRQRAQAAGNLQPTLQEAVNYVGGNIALAPVNPQVVYVPVYNPWTVYGQPVSPYPGFSFVGTLGSFASNALQFGVGIATNAFTRMPWGLLAWGVSWLVQAILFHNSNYYSQNAGVADWGFPNGSPRAGVAFAATGGSYPRVNQGYGPAFANGFVHRPPSSYRYGSNPYSASRVRPYSYRPYGAEAYVHRPGTSYGYPRAGYGSAGSQAYVHRPAGSYSGYRPVAGAGRTYPGFGYSGAGRQPYASSAASRSPYANRSFPTSPQRQGFGQRAPSQSASRGFGGSTKIAHAGGFHPFESEHGSGGFGGGHAPKMKAPKAPKAYSGHSGGGGHSGGHSGGKHHH